MVNLIRAVKLGIGNLVPNCLVLVFERNWQQQFALVLYNNNNNKEFVWSS